MELYNFIRGSTLKGSNTYKINDYHATFVSPTYNPCFLQQFPEDA